MARGPAFIEPQHVPHVGSQTWPGFELPWVPTRARQRPSLPGQVCLGVECFSTSPSASDAKKMHQILMQRSVPLADASLAAVALYEAGYWAWANGAMRVYGGEHGMAKTEEAILRVYQDCSCECPVAHYHRDDPTCRAGGQGAEPGAQNGPHYHEGSRSCHAGDPDPASAATGYVCVRPHHHVGDPSWRPAP